MEVLVKCRIIALLSLASTLFGSSNIFAYEVWMRTSHTPQAAAREPDAWEKTASLVEGLNINMASGNRGKDSTERPCTEDDWMKVFGLIEHRDNGLAPFARSGFGPTGPHAKVTLTQKLDEKFARAEEYGYGIQNIMFFGNRSETEDFHGTFLTFDRCGATWMLMDAKTWGSLKTHAPMRREHGIGARTL